MTARSLRRAITALGACLILCALLSIFIAEAALHPQRRRLSAEEITYVHDLADRMQVDLADVSSTTTDGVTLRAWKLRPAHPNGDSVILLHGLSDNRLGMIGYAELLLAHHYVVLMPDARAHGESGGAIATYGLLERTDVRRWYEFLVADSHPRCVFGFAESMGAAQLLQAARTPFCAIAAESPFSNFREIAYDRFGQFFHVGPWLGRTIFRPVIESSLSYVRWKYSFDLESVSPEEVVIGVNTPILLIHGTDDRNIPVRHSYRILAHNPHIVLWEVPQTDHCGAISTHPEEFAAKLLQWLQLPASNHPHG
jgi:uncharacterized protein